MYCKFEFMDFEDIARYGQEDIYLPGMVDRNEDQAIDKNICLVNMKYIIFLFWLEYACE